MSVEKNDVDIARLFYYGKAFLMSGKNEEEITVYMRLVGDADLNRARVFALRRSAELRSKLKAEDTDEHIAYISTLDGLEKDKIVEMIAILSIREFTQAAIKELTLPYPKEPKSEATLEEMEKHQKEVDEFPRKRAEEIGKIVGKKLDHLRESLQKESEKKLHKMYEISLISELCEQEMIRKFTECCSYFGSYRDESFKEKLFSSFEEFDNLPSNIKEIFISNYQLLETGPEELKKLPEATQ